MQVRQLPAAAQADPGTALVPPNDDRLNNAGHDRRGGADAATGARAAAVNRGAAAPAGPDRHAALRAVPRPGKRKNPDDAAAIAEPVPTALAESLAEPPVLHGLPHGVLRHIGSFMTPGEKSATRLASLSRNLSHALHHHALADRLVKCIDAPMPDADRVDLALRIMSHALQLPDDLRLEVARHVLLALPEFLPAGDFRVALPFDALRALIAGLHDKASRYQLMLAYAGMLALPRVWQISERPAMPADVPFGPVPEMVALRNAFLADCASCLASCNATEIDHAELYGAIALSLSFCNQPADRTSAWHGFLDRADCGSGDVRMPLLCSLVAAMATLPAGAPREHAFSRMVGQLPSLSAPEAVKLTAILTHSIAFMAGEFSRLVAFDLLRHAACRLPQPQRCAAMQCLFGALDTQPVHRRQALYDAMRGEARDCAPEIKANLLDARLAVNTLLPTVGSRIAAIEDIFDELEELGEALAADLGFAVIEVVRQIPDDVLRQIYVEKAIGFVHGFAPAVRGSMIEALIAAAETVDSPGARMAASLQVVALIDAQPSADRAALLSMMYDCLDEEQQSEDMYALMGVLDRAARSIPVHQKAALVDKAARTCMWLEDAFLPLQFKTILGVAAALPEPYCTRALDSATAALAAAIDALGGGDPFMLGDSYDALLRAAALLPVERRYALLEKLAFALDLFPAETVQPATDRITAEILRLPHVLRGPIMAIVLDA